MLAEMFKGLMMVLALAGGVSAASATYEPPHRQRPLVDEGCRELPAPAPAAPPVVAICS